MNLTASRLSSYYYQLYAFNSASSASDTDKALKSEASAGNSDNAQTSESEYLKKYYNISNLDNALDALKSANSISVFSIGNIALYAKNLYDFSQSDDFETLSDSLADTVSTSGISVLTGNANTDGIYKLLGTDEETLAFLKCLAGSNGGIDSFTNLF